MYFSVHITTSLNGKKKYIIRDPVIGKKQYGYTVPVNIWSAVTEPVYQAECHGY